MCFKWPFIFQSSYTKSVRISFLLHICQMFHLYHSILFIYLRSVLILFWHQRTCVLSGHLSSSLHTPDLYVCLFFSICAKCSTCIIRFYLFTVFLFDEWHKYYDFHYACFCSFHIFSPSSSSKVHFWTANARISLANIFPLTFWTRNYFFSFSTPCI